MSTTLYNKWRPRTFAEPRDRPLVGQEAVARTLRQAILHSQIAHAYLFCGPRGTGKTSAARIFARAVNCLRGLLGEPCNVCANCVSMLDGRQLDLLVEIDAASNRGVEDARILRDRLLQRPGGDGVTGRYKVYIIDEVHMLTKEAFNTLLKSLEEPPPHVIFILATTDPQEVLPTILSRCQRFDFRAVAIEQLVAHLGHVASEEGVLVDRRALETIARAARGGLRDAISLLDQSFAYIGGVSGEETRHVSEAQVEAMLGLSRADAVAGIIRAIGDRDMAEALRGTHRALAGGADVRSFIRQVVEALRAILLELGGAPEVADIDPAVREAVALHTRRYTLGQVIRAIRALSGLDATLRARSVDAVLLFEVTLAELVSDTTGLAPTATAAPLSRPVAVPTIAPSKSDDNAASTSEEASPPNGTHGAVGDTMKSVAAPTGTVSEAQDDGRVAERLDPNPRGRDGDDDPPRSAGSWTTPEEPSRPAGNTRLPLSVPAASPPRPVRTGGWPTLDAVVLGWPAVIESVRSEGMAPLIGLLNGSIPTSVQADGTIVVQCASSFALQKLRDAANQIGIERCLSRTFGQQLRIRFETLGGGLSEARRKASAPGVQDAFVARAARMLGGRPLGTPELADLDQQRKLRIDSVVE